MTMYLLMLAGAVVLGVPLCSETFGKWGKAAYCLICAAAFVVISALRFEVGYDYNLYGKYYAEMVYMDIGDISQIRMEKGFLVPLYALSLSFEKYYSVFIYTSVIIYPAIFALIYKYSSVPWISAAAFLCFGVYFNSLCFLRQIIAAVIILYAMKFVTLKKPLEFFLLTVSAAAFHWSSLVFLVLYFLIQIKPSAVYTGIVAAGMVVFCVFSKQLMYLAIDVFYMYKGYDPELSGEASSGLSPRYTIIFGILFILAFLFRKKLLEKNSSNAYYINCLMYAVVFEAMGMKHGILSRFSLLVIIPPIIYLIPDLCIVIKEFISRKIGRADRRSIALTLSTLAGAVYGFCCFMLLMANNYNGVVPYMSLINRPYEIFEEQKSEGEGDYSWYEDDINEDFYDEEFDEEDDETVEISEEDLTWE